VYIHLIQADICRVEFFSGPIALYERSKPKFFGVPNPFRHLPPYPPHYPSFNSPLPFFPFLFLPLPLSPFRSMPLKCHFMIHNNRPYNSKIKVDCHQAVTRSSARPIAVIADRTACSMLTLFILSYAKKVGVRYPPFQKVGEGVSVPP